MESCGHYFKDRNFKIRILDFDFNNDKLLMNLNTQSDNQFKWRVC